MLNIHDTCIDIDNSAAAEFMCYCFGFLITFQYSTWYLR